MTAVVLNVDGYDPVTPTEVVTPLVEESVSFDESRATRLHDH